jgi:hypothetical protein
MLAVFIPVSNERVFTCVPPYECDLNKEVLDWLRTSAYPWYVCRKPGRCGYQNLAGEWFYFSKESAATMFKLAWGGEC